MKLGLFCVAVCGCWRGGPPEPSPAVSPPADAAPPAVWRQRPPDTLPAQIAIVDAGPPPLPPPPASGCIRRRIFAVNITGPDVDTTVTNVASSGVTTSFKATLADPAHTPGQIRAVDPHRVTVRFSGISVTTVSTYTFVDLCP